MNQWFNFVRRKPKSCRPQRLWLLFLGMVTFLLPVSLNGWLETPLQAQYAPATNSTNIWRSASFPVENFQSYTSGFGYRTSPVTGQSQFHQGLDLAAPLGSYVRNWWEGRVISLSDHTACGTMIQIQSGQWTHVYCHLMGSVEDSPQGRYLIDREGGIVLWQGQDVPVGARIGRVGMTGRTTGPHLHWGLKYGGQYLDPALVLREMFRGQTSS
ncbi:M23 family metallopeptidase [Crocosphaera sp. XPORK-15E]|uniref:M23 family metallopeptidase n=1 Tax=Crocosphaera sp. XPORK-15E TaxID=3110247 RepID=UPI002B1EAF57|nr:M23 family metallopeptidase [Crocosphaera sp. XPORK-15E]MEA5534627.1 M23 family metallopeptidase [Crocosphaera sp. XPORK-15E]